MLIWTSFDSFAITYLSVFLQKFNFPIEVVLSFQTTVFVEFFYQIFSFGI